MKVKLLKKVRKEFGWYINGNGYPVLIKYKLQRVILFNLDYCLRETGYKNLEEANLEVDPQTWAWRLLKYRILHKYGWTLDRHWYKHALRKSAIKNWKLYGTQNSSTVDDGAGVPGSDKGKVQSDG
jgi:hypothetical protein